MHINSLLRTTALAIAVCSLAACSTTNKDAAATSGAGGAMNGAHAQGLGGPNKFGDNNGLSAEQANRLKAPYDQTYLFDFDKYEVYQEDVASIEAQANYLAAHTNAKVRLEGNADERGSREYNIALGWKRAKAVADILEQQGVEKSQIATVSYGKEKPAALGHDEESYRLNRRVGLVYEAK